MKFVIESVSKCSGRLGTLTSIERLPDMSFKTPILLQTTKGGSVPYMSREVLELTTDLKDTVLSVNLTTTWHMLDAVTSSGKGIASFAALPDCLTFLCVRDTSEESKSGHHEKAGVPLFTRHGKKILSPEVFMDYVEAFRPDFFHLLADGDTRETSSKKRGTQSVTRTLDFAQKCLERRAKNEKLRKIFTLAPIVGGFSHMNCRKSLEFAKNAPEVDGFFIDGLHGNGDSALFVPAKETLEIVEFCAENLPEEKLKMILGAFPPLLVLKMIQLGVDVFDNSFPLLCGARNRALVFDFQPEARKEEKRKNLLIDLGSEGFREDFRPVLEGCECLTCQQHTRAYLRHLVDCKELMGTILLNMCGISTRQLCELTKCEVIAVPPANLTSKATLRGPKTRAYPLSGLFSHNFHHYRAFFRSIRHHIAKDTLSDLISLIEEQSAEEDFSAIFPPTNTSIANGGSRSPSTVGSDT